MSDPNSDLSDRDSDMSDPDIFTAAERGSCVVSTNQRPVVTWR